MISSMPQINLQAQAGSVLSIQAWPPQGLGQRPAGVWKQPCRSKLSKKLCDQHVVASQDQKLLNQLTGNWRHLVNEWSFFSEQTSVYCIYIYIHLSLLINVYFWLYILTCMQHMHIKKVNAWPHAVYRSSIDHGKWRTWHPFSTSDIPSAPEPCPSIWSLWMMWIPSGLLYTDAPEITGLANLPLGLALGPVYQLINVSLLGCA